MYGFNYEIIKEMREQFFLAIRGVVALLANYPFMSGSSIWLFRHLEHQNQFIISDFIGKTIRFPKFFMELLNNIFYWTPAFLMCFYAYKYFLPFLSSFEALWEGKPA